MSNATPDPFRDLVNALGTGAAAGIVARMSPAPLENRRALIASVVDQWHPEAAFTATMYACALVFGLVKPIEDPEKDYLQVPRALHLAPTITWFEDGEERYEIDPEHWDMGVSGLADLGRGLRPGENSVDDIPGDDSVFGSWLVEPTIFAEFGLFAEQFFVAIPDVLTAAVEFLGARNVNPREWLSEYIEVPA